MAIAIVETWTRLLRNNKWANGYSVYDKRLLGYILAMCIRDHYKWLKQDGEHNLFYCMWNITEYNIFVIRCSYRWFTNLKLQQQATLNKSAFEYM